MKLSTAGLELIKKSEGFRGRTYLDVAGIPTIGYGHRLLPKQVFPEGVSEAQAADMLALDVRQAEQAVGRLVRILLSQGRFDALVDFCFNLGEGRLASSTLLKVLNGARYEAAGEQLLRWDLAAGQVNTGLKGRREAELDLWQSKSAEQAA